MLMLDASSAMDEQKPKRRHEDAECAMQERIKRLRIGGSPWCARARLARPPHFLPCFPSADGPLKSRAVRSAQHSPMSQPPHSTMMPHPGLARSWANAAPQQPHTVFPGCAPVQPTPFVTPQVLPFGAPTPASPFGSGATPGYGVGVGWSGLAAAASMAPSLQPNYHAQQLQQSPHHMASSPYGGAQQHASLTPVQHALTPTHPGASPVLAPAHSLLTPQAKPPAWELLSAGNTREACIESPYSDCAPPSHYKGINQLLGALHCERVHAGVRSRWQCDDDDDDDEDL